MYELKVQSVAHLLDLLRRGYSKYKLEAEIQPSKEIRSTSLYVRQPEKFYSSKLTNSFGYDICVLVLSDEGKQYKASVYCLSDWSGHDIAKELEKWA